MRSVLLHLERHLTKSLVKDRVWIYVTQLLASLPLGKLINFVLNLFVFGSFSVSETVNRQ